MIRRPALLAGAAFFAIGIGAVSASITIDLRLIPAGSTVGGVIYGNGKGVWFANSGQITLQVWAQVTNAAPTNNIFGVQTIYGSIISSPGASVTSGALSTMTIGAPWDNQNQVGMAQELTSPADGVLDLGSTISTGTGVPTTYIKFRKDPTAGGEQVGTVLYATNNQPLGATVQPITNGFEFLMGTVTFSITTFGSPVPPTTLNWVIPTASSVAVRGQIAAWTDGDNANNNGNTNSAEMFVGAPVIFGIPEPGTLAVLLSGTGVLLGWRRRRSDGGSPFRGAL